MLYALQNQFGYVNGIIFLLAHRAESWCQPFAPTVSGHTLMKGSDLGWSKTTQKPIINLNTIKSNCFSHRKLYMDRVHADQERNMGPNLASSS